MPARQTCKFALMGEYPPNTEDYGYYTETNGFLYFSPVSLQAVREFGEEIKIAPIILGPDGEYSVVHEIITKGMRSVKRKGIERLASEAENLMNKHKERGVIDIQRSFSLGTNERDSSIHKGKSKRPGSSRVYGGAKIRYEMH